METVCSLVYTVVIAQGHLATRERKCQNTTCPFLPEDAAWHSAQSLISVTLSPSGWIQLPGRSGIFSFHKGDYLWAWVRPLSHGGTISCFAKEVYVCSLSRVTNISESQHEDGWISNIKIFLDQKRRIFIRSYPFTSTKYFVERTYMRCTICWYFTFYPNSTVKKYFHQKCKICGLSKFLWKKGISPHGSKDEL